MKTDYKLIKDTELGLVSLFFGDYQLAMWTFEEWSYLIANPLVLPAHIEESEHTQEPAV